MTIIAEPPIVQTPEAIAEIAFERMKEKYPAWNPNPADPTYQMFLAYAFIASEVMLLAIDIPEEIIRIIGESVYQTTFETATFATGHTTWEAIDNLGYTIPRGTVVIAEPEGGEAVAYETIEDVEIPVGETKTTIGGVVVQAVEAGEEGNIETTSNIKAAPVELLSFIKKVEFVGQPGGAVEEESTEEYVERVLELARIIKPQPILPQDFADFARLLIPGLRGSRILALDLTQMALPYPQGTPNTSIVSSSVERCVTIIPVLENGKEPSEAICREAWELLESRREASFKAFVGSPTYTSVSVNVVGTCEVGAKAGTEEAVKSALESYLSPEQWGTNNVVGAQAGTWSQRKVVRFQDIVTVVNNVSGFSHYTTLEINGAQVDVTLPGVAPLAEAGTITISLTESTEP